MKKLFFKIFLGFLIFLYTLYHSSFFEIFHQLEIKYNCIFQSIIIFNFLNDRFNYNLLYDFLNF